jgi:hypothetical protein
MTTTTPQVIDQIYNTIGRKTLFMLGAKNIGYSTEKGLNYLQFKISGSKEFTHIRIAYNAGKDLFDITFFKIVKYSIRKEEKFEGYYNDMIHALIEKKTGLRTSL